MTAHRDPLATAEHNARIWLAAVAEGLGTDDRTLAYRVLRAWLHGVRDRLSVNGAVHLAAQLPEFVRGVYYEDWTPNHPTARLTQAEFIDGFARAAHLERAEAEAAMAAVTAVLRHRFSPGQLQHALAQLPQPLRSVLHGAPVEDLAMPAG